jgi:hypothetical protein
MVGEKAKTSDVTRKTTHRTSSKLHSELTPSEIQRFGASNIGNLFSNLNSGLNEVWEDYVTLNFYMREIPKQIKAGSLARVAIPRLVHEPRMEPLNHNAVYGIASRIRDKTSGRHAFIDAISLFEHFMSMLVFRVYSDFPRKLKGLAQDGSIEADGRRQKLIDVILESADRHEMIQKLVEEKVRGIFYGNPLDLFAKNKADIGFGSYFKDNKSSLLNTFQEITARRNVIIHNESRIDRKYLAEVSESKLDLGRVVHIDEIYLRRALLVIKDLAASSAQLVATNVYKDPLRGRAKKIQTAIKKRPIA